LLAAEITARTGLDPAQYFQHLSALLGRSYYRRIDLKASPEQKLRLKAVTAEALAFKELAGDPVMATLSRDPENGAPIGGLKVVTARGWFAARPSGTEDIIKIYAESWRSAEHLRAIIQQACSELGRLSGDTSLTPPEEAAPNCPATG